MKHEKTFAAIDKLKEVESELLRLMNALELANKALDDELEPVTWAVPKLHPIMEYRFSRFIPRPKLFKQALERT